MVDQTGAGDAFVGTLTARLVLGDGLPAAARYGAAAASLVVGGKGGTGFIPTFDQTRAHAAPPAPRGRRAVIARLSPVHAGRQRKPTRNRMPARTS